MTEGDRKYSDNLVRAREVLHGLWGEVFWDGAHGRCWGSKKNKNSPLWGSDAVFVLDGEVVIVSLNPKDGQLRIYSFSENSNTKLGERVTTLLKDAGLVK